MIDSTNINDYKDKHLHFVGIGGCSMSGLALIASQLGYKITGSDKNDSPFVQRLIKSGIPVALDHDTRNIGDASLLIYSAAIKPDNPERIFAANNNIPQMERSVFLGQISGHFKEVVAIAGCHGKTTITSMLAKIMLHAGKNPNVHIGGFVDFLNGGVALGESDLFITEACEYVDSFLAIDPTCILINNIDDDHLDYFADINAIIESFEKFVAKLNNKKLLIGCVDDPHVKKIMQNYSGRKITYSLTNNDSNYTIRNLSVEEGKTVFDVHYNQAFILRIILQVPGNHNALNALAAIAIAREYGADDHLIVEALADYNLTRRRFEYYGTRNGILYYHDYAHHPNEIRACLQGARSVCKNKLIAVFQCNSYTRAKTLFSENVDCFSLADEVLIPDIYPGRETDTGLVHAKDMQQCITDTKATYLATFEAIREYIDEHYSAGDLVVTLGSGDVYIQTKKLL